MAADSGHRRGEIIFQSGSKGSGLVLVCEDRTHDHDLDECFEPWHVDFWSGTIDCCFIDPLWEREKNHTKNVDGMYINWGDCKEDGLRCFPRLFLLPIKCSNECSGHTDECYAEEFIKPNGQHFVLDCRGNHFVGRNGWRLPHNERCYRLKKAVVTAAADWGKEAAAASDAEELVDAAAADTPDAVDTPDAAVIPKNKKKQKNKKNKKQPPLLLSQEMPEAPPTTTQRRSHFPPIEDITPPAGPLDHKLLICRDKSRDHVHRFPKCFVKAKNNGFGHWSGNIDCCPYVLRPEPRGEMTMEDAVYLHKCIAKHEKIKYDDCFHDFADCAAGKREGRRCFIRQFVLPTICDEIHVHEPECFAEEFVTAGGQRFVLDCPEQRQNEDVDVDEGRRNEEFHHYVGRNGRRASHDKRCYKLVEEDFYGERKPAKEFDLNGKRRLFDVRVSLGTGGVIGGVEKKVKQTQLGMGLMGKQFSSKFVINDDEDGKESMPIFGLESLAALGKMAGKKANGKNDISSNRPATVNIGGANARATYTPTDLPFKNLSIGKEIEKKNEKKNKNNSQVKAGNNNDNIGLPSNNPGADADAESTRRAPRRRVCAFADCDAAEDPAPTFKTCLKCREEGVATPAHYCGKACQTEDWKRRHRAWHLERKHTNPED